MRTFRIVVAFSVLLAAAFSLHAAEHGWKLLGERTVSDRAERDVIVVTAAEGDLEALQIRVDRHAVQFHEVIVHFANGGDQTLALRDVIGAGGSSRVLALDGGERVVRSVELRYDAQTVRGRRARVRLYGKR